MSVAAKMVRIRYFWAAMPPDDDARSMMLIRWFPDSPGDVPLRNRFSWRKAPLAPPLGELLSECEAEGVYSTLNGIRQNFLSSWLFNHNFERFAAFCNTPVGSQGGFAARVAKLATPTRASAFIWVLPKIRGCGENHKPTATNVPRSLCDSLSAAYGGCSLA